MLLGKASVNCLCGQPKKFASGVKTSYPAQRDWVCPACGNSGTHFMVGDDDYYHDFASAVEAERTLGLRASSRREEERKRRAADH